MENELMELKESNNELNAQIEYLTMMTGINTEVVHEQKLEKVKRIFNNKFRV